MLVSLKIKNYLIIDNVEINFKNGFTIITGETGSGKSIILDAFSLLLGKRADSDVLMDPSSKCILEAVFNIDIEKFEKLFIDNDIDISEETIIRREILSSGKTRAFINDSPVTLAVLKSVGEAFIDIHSQHENISLKSSKYRMQIVDYLANTDALSKQYQNKYQVYQNLQKESTLLIEELNSVKKELEYYQYQAQEIEDLSIESDLELETLEAEASLLENASEIRGKFHIVLNALEKSEYSAENLLKEAKNNIDKISSKYKHGEEISSRIDSLIIELRDINSQIENDAEKAEINPQLLEKYNDRINSINMLLNKHKVGSVSELLDKYAEFRSYIDNSDQLENQLSECNKRLDKSLSELKSIAVDLSSKREKTFELIESKILKILNELGITKAKFRIENLKQDFPSSYGFDNINFLFSANSSMAVQPIEKVASGGEFSRLMLTLKSIIANARSTDTIIFDEIDTGVSGEISAKMGKIMKKMSESHTQVVSITHLPQVAALGDEHFKVYKIEDNNKTFTKVKLLSPDERTYEIASMISGEKLSPQAIENAKILLSSN